MKSLNILLAYSASSFWIVIVLVLTISPNYLSKEVFWIALFVLAAPTGMLLEPIYSLYYSFLVLLLKKTKILNIMINLLFKKNKCYFENFKINTKDYMEDKKFQMFLSENNFLRNTWISTIVCIFIIAFSYNTFFLNIDRFYLVYFVPTITILAIVGNIRKEYQLKKLKYLIMEDKKNEY
ncbi:hypothetical protein [Spiroplasma turonicum]|uniref:hypothetical protein n=1 Tax=Spiroplasma turonicum TaxID=216946 RepID=UPI00118733BA|nr:hypothetical protein [Spiroplasma turonicum]